MAIINSFGGMPAFGPGGFGPSIWLAFNALVAKFWQLLEAGKLEEAEAVLEEIFALSRGLAPLMATYERCLAALEAALEAVGGVVEAVEVVGGAFTLPSSGIIICVAIFALWAVGGGSQPKYGEGSSSGGPVSWYPHPIKRAEEFDKLEKFLFKHPYQAGRLISAPKSKYISHKAQVAAARVLLRTMKAFKGNQIWQQA